MLIVEDGTIVSGANSYTSAATLRAYALSRGVILAATDGPGNELVDQMAIKAMDYIEAHRKRFAGWKVNQNQRLSFPRNGVPLDDYSVNGFTRVNGQENILDGTGYRNSSPLPFELIDAQCQLVMHIKAGVNLLPSQASEYFVKKEKIGPIETEYSDAFNRRELPVLPDVERSLEPLFRAGGAMTSYRR